MLTSGSHHIRYVGPSMTLRLTTNAPVDYVRDETPFNLNSPIDLILGADETLSEGVTQTADVFEERTRTYWRQWVHRLAIPFEWQEAVIRAAVTLKLCTYEPTGAIVAALTTSIPEAPNTHRTWDYRFCWLRDAYFVVRALKSSRSYSKDGELLRLADEYRLSFNRRTFASGLWGRAGVASRRADCFVLAWLSGNGSGTDRQSSVYAFSARQLWECRSGSRASVF